MSRARIDRAHAREILANCHVDPKSDQFHALSTEQVGALFMEANAYGYRAPRNANGSRTRYFHAYLVRQANRQED